MRVEDLLQKNERLCEMLLNRENIPELERLLEREGAQFFKLKKACSLGRLDFGQYIDSRKELRDTFRDVKQKVDSFLGIKNIQNPKIYLEDVSDKKILEQVPPRYRFGLDNFVSNGLYFNNGIIILKNIRLANLVGVMIHEYVHHIQHKILGKEVYEELNVSIEGNAIGVERRVCEMYADAAWNPAFKYKTMDKTVAALNFVYQWVCEQIGNPINWQITYIRTDKGEDEKQIMSDTGLPSEHAMGYALFAIANEKHGDRIYAEVFRK